MGNTQWVGARLGLWESHFPLANHRKQSIFWPLLYSRATYPIPHRQSTRHWNYNWVGSNDAMTHVLVFENVRVRRNERLNWAVMVDFIHWWYVQAYFWLQSSQWFQFQRIKSWKFYSPSGSYLPTRENDLHHLIHTSPDLMQNLSSDRLWVPLLHVQGRKVIASRKHGEKEP